MNTYSLFIKKNIVIFLIGIFGNALHSQFLHVDYIQKSGTPQKFEIEVWVSNTSNSEMKLSALNTVFAYDTDILFDGKVSFQLSPKFAKITEPLFGNLSNQKKIRCTMVPVSSLNDAILIGEKPELFGKLSFISGDKLSYPIKATPAISGNPTIQAVVYVNQSQNSGALTLKNMSITTDENPLVLRLMTNKFEVKYAFAEFDIYPNPTTHVVNYNLSSDVLDEKASATVLDAEGRLVSSFLLKGQNQGVIDFSSYSSGVYYIWFENGNQTEKHKVIKI